MRYPLMVPIFNCLFLVSQYEKSVKIFPIELGYAEEVIENL